MSPFLENNANLYEFSYLITPYLGFLICNIETVLVMRPQWDCWSASLKQCSKFLTTMPGTQKAPS